MQQKIAQKPSLDFIMKSDFDRQPYIAPICNALDMETDSELFVCTSIMASTDEQSSHDVDIKA